MTDFDPTQNRIQTLHLTPSELNAITTSKHGVQFYSGGSWHDKTGGEFFPTDVYRAKPAPRPTIMVNGIAVPGPVRTALADETKYWLATPGEQNFANDFNWGSDDLDHLWLSRGLIHLSEADAITHARAMCAPGMMGGV